MAKWFFDEEMGTAGRNTLLHVAEYQDLSGVAMRSI